jgi:hypothetical protein
MHAVTVGFSNGNTNTTTTEMAAGKSDWSLSARLAMLFSFRNVLYSSRPQPVWQPCGVPFMKHRLMAVLFLMLLVVDVSIVGLTLLEMWCVPAPGVPCDQHFLLALFLMPFASFGAPLYGVAAVAFQSSFALRRVRALLLSNRCSLRRRRFYRHRHRHRHRLSLLSFLRLLLLLSCQSLPHCVIVLATSSRT